MNQLIETIESDQLKKDLPEFKVGDTISIHYQIIEGEKTRIQIFTGTVIARKGKGVSETVSIYRVAYGSAMERVLLLHSPRVTKVEVVKRGKVRKSKLYHLRGIFGKKAKIKELIVKTTSANKVTDLQEKVSSKKEASSENEESPKAPQSKKASEKKEKTEISNEEKAPEQKSKDED